MALLWSFICIYPSLYLVLITVQLPQALLPALTIFSHFLRVSPWKLKYIALLRYRDCDFEGAGEKNLWKSYETILQHIQECIKLSSASLKIFFFLSAMNDSLIAKNISELFFLILFDPSIYISSMSHHLGTSSCERKIFSLQ